jgi:hypothetical protein
VLVDDRGWVDVVKVWQGVGLSGVGWRDGLFAKFHKVSVYEASVYEVSVYEVSVDKLRLHLFVMQLTSHSGSSFTFDTLA